MSKCVKAAVTVALCWITAACFVVAGTVAAATCTDQNGSDQLHCFGCYWALAATADVVAAVHVTPSIEPVGAAHLSSPLQPLETPTLDTASRGPPQA